MGSGTRLPPRFHVLAQLASSARDLDDFYFPLTEEELEKAKEESEMEVEFEERGKKETEDKVAEMEEKDVENALASRLEPTTSEVEGECANHKTTLSQTNFKH